MLTYFFPPLYDSYILLVMNVINTVLYKKVQNSALAAETSTVK